MFKKVKISTKIFALVLTLIIFIVVTESILSFIRIKGVIKEDFTTELSFVAEVQEHKLEHYFVGIETDLKHIQSNKLIQEVLPSIIEAMVLNMDSAVGLNLILKEEVFNTFQDIYHFDDLLLVTQQGRVAYDHADVRNLGAEFLHFDEKRLEGFYFDQVAKEGKFFYNYASLPIKVHGLTIGFVACKINVRDIISDVMDTVGLGTTGEVMFGKLLNKKTAYLNSPRRGDKTLPKVVESNHPIFLSSSGANGHGIYKDYKGSEVLAVWHHVPSLNVGLVTKINTEEVFEKLPQQMWLVILKGFVVFIIAVLITYVFTIRFTRPIALLKNVLDKIRKGNLPKKITQTTNDEIGEMALVVNNVIDTLNESAEFAQKIGKEDFDSTQGYTPISEEDKLGHALMDMRTNLMQTHEKDQVQGWILEGTTQVSEVLRVNNTIQEVCDKLTSYLYDRLKARYVCVYMTDEESKDKMSLELQSCYAYGKKKHINRTFKFAESLVGQAAAERDTIYTTDIDKSYDFISTGLKDDPKPDSVLLIPLIANERLHGVIEIAADKQFEKREISFVEETTESIAQTLFNLKVNEQTRTLLEEISHAQNRIQNLLQNATELIAVYDTEFRISYISPSVDAILGYSTEELINTSDLENISDKHRGKFKQLMQQIIDFPDRDAVIEYEYTRKDGEEVWLEAVGKNMIGDPAIKGVVFNISDITARRLAEEEQRMRGRMQALSENSLDLITRISREGEISYTNPTIKTLTGIDVNAFVNKHLDEVDLDDSIKESWKGLIDEVVATGKKAAIEIDFPTIDETKIMTINGMPEYGEGRTIESVLLVSHDITIQKKTELDIRHKNKKIHDSINYAERIQFSILPEQHLIQEALPNSFVMYKPRDVVSGDFPWLMEKDGCIYLAAVDCTGHGVPGALISIVGYFLLNNIVKYNVADTPSKILDNLDAMVTETFKQNLESSKIKDGMDVGFIKIDQKNKRCEYAGAHRPLYLIRDGELQEIKGDKFPIGGGSAYKNKTDFLNTVIDYKEGDTFYFFSDGLPDQFGGPKDRKFGPKRIKELIQVHADKDIKEIGQIFEDTYTEWKGDEKQFDDILLYGIRL